MSCAMQAVLREGGKERNRVGERERGERGGWGRQDRGEVEGREERQIYQGPDWSTDILQVC